ncbi:hypothetical protein BH23BAC4_BH23BAC4_11130 [soil metagenome]
MGQALLIAVAAAALFGTMSLVGGTGESARRAASDVNEHSDRLIAREIALSGHTVAVMNVLHDVGANGTYSGPTSFSGEYQGGTYSTSVTTEPGELNLVTRGLLENTTYVVRASYEYQAGTDVDEDVSVPDFMRYAALVQNTLRMRGNATIYASNGLNANVHSNSGIDIGGNASIQGFGTFSNGNVNVNSQSPKFRPPSNPDGEPTLRSAPAVHIPAFNAADHRHLATHVLEGNFNLSSAALGTRQQPAIYYVAGNLTANTGVLAGYGIFLVQGNITINGNVNATGGLNGESNVAFYSTGNVILNGTATLAGQIFANGNARFNGTARLYGSMTARGNTTFSGNMNIYFRNPSGALTAPIWPSEDGPRVLALNNFREGG